MRRNIGDDTHRKIYEVRDALLSVEQKAIGVNLAAIWDEQMDAETNVETIAWRMARIVTTDLK